MEQAAKNNVVVSRPVYTRKLNQKLNLVEFQNIVLEDNSTFAQKSLINMNDKKEISIILPDNYWKLSHSLEKYSPQNTSIKKSKAPLGVSTWNVAGGDYIVDANNTVTIKSFESKQRNQQLALCGVLLFSCVFIFSILSALFELNLL